MQGMTFIFPHYFLWNIIIFHYLQKIEEEVEATKSVIKMRRHEPH